MIQESLIYILHLNQIYILHINQIVNNDYKSD
jgi:hypothetical protein